MIVTNISETKKETIAESFKSNPSDVVFDNISKNSGKIKIDEPFVKDDQSVIEEFQFMPRGDDR